MSKRALISVTDKSGVVEFARELNNLGYEVISTGNTFKILKENGVNAITIDEVTKFPEMLDGRVKTLNPYIHGGILYKRDEKSHVDTVNEYNIGSIDLVVVNLYDFEGTLKAGKSHEEMIENIDIGGPSMIRSAAKNYKDVTIIVDVADYDTIIEKLKNNELTLEDRKRLAYKAFSTTARYDALISTYFANEVGDKYPEILNLTFQKEQTLRYGENPHQGAAYYSSTEFDGAMNSFEILNGKALSYNNIKDLDIAWKVACEFEETACCALKHNTPCGVAVGENSKEVYLKAYDADPVSIFGGIVAINRKIDKATAEEMVKIFLEVVAAPDFDEDALEVLRTKKNLRVIKCKNTPQAKNYMVTVDGGILVQGEDNKLANEYKVVTEKEPTEMELRDMIFGMKVVKYVKSNAIVVVKDGVATGIGGGQVNRIWATKEALERGKGGAVLASDAFFPFRDCVDEAAKNGIKAIIQPGGSIRDEESIEACNEHGISMVFTGVRHFKH